MSDVNLPGVVDDAAKVVKDALQAQPKPFYKSKTFWANALLTGANYFGYLPAQVGFPVSIAANVILRYLTTGPVSVK